MSITLLLDLDDTLLDTNMDAFIPAYFKALSKALADRVPPETMLAALMGGTNAMLKNTDPGLTLQQVFDAHFFPKLGLERAGLQAAIDRFYDEVFPSLGSLTHPIPEAVRLVDWAFAQGHRVAIATNPLFPQKAIQHRLRWAGLPPEKYPFALITSYERLHFTKETVAYYPEVLAQLGWPDEPVVMVGDDIEREVKPTRAAGVPVYWVRKDGKTAEPDDVPQGQLSDFRGWLEGADPAGLRVNPATPQALVALLRSTPAALASLTADLSTETWSHRPAAGEWCLTEIVSHLRDYEAVNLERLSKVLAETNPFLAGEETDRWVEERGYASQDGPKALAEFTTLRKESLARVAELQSEWSRPARHAIFGPTTLQELVAFTGAHDRTHVHQAWAARPVS